MDMMRRGADQGNVPHDDLYVESMTAARPGLSVAVARPKDGEHKAEVRENINDVALGMCALAERRRLSFHALSEYTEWSQEEICKPTIEAALA